MDADAAGAPAAALESARRAAAQPPSFVLPRPPARPFSAASALAALQRRARVTEALGLPPHALGGSLRQQEAARALRVAGRARRAAYAYCPQLRAQATAAQTCNHSTSYGQPPPHTNDAAAEPGHALHSLLAAATTERLQGAAAGSRHTEANGRRRRSEDRSGRPTNDAAGSTLTWRSLQQATLRCWQAQATLSRFQSALSEQAGKLLSRPERRREEELLLLRAEEQAVEARDKLGNAALNVHAGLLLEQMTRATAAAAGPRAGADGGSGVAETEEALKEAERGGGVEVPGLAYEDVFTGDVEAPGAEGLAARAVLLLAGLLDVAEQCDAAAEDGDTSGGGTLRAEIAEVHEHCWVRSTALAQALLTMCGEPCLPHGELQEAVVGLGFMQMAIHQRLAARREHAPVPHACRSVAAVRAIVHMAREAAAALGLAWPHRTKCVLVAVKTHARILANVEGRVHSVAARDASYRDDPAGALRRAWHLQYSVQARIFARIVEQQLPRAGDDEERRQELQLHLQLLARLPTALPWERPPRAAVLPLQLACSLEPAAMGAQRSALAGALLAACLDGRSRMVTATGDRALQLLLTAAAAATLLSRMRVKAESDSGGSEIQEPATGPLGDNTPPVALQLLSWVPPPAAAPPHTRTESEYCFRLLHAPGWLYDSVADRVRSCDLTLNPHGVKAAGSQRLAAAGLARYGVASTVCQGRQELADAVALLSERVAAGASGGPRRSGGGEGEGGEDEGERLLLLPVLADGEQERLVGIGAQRIEYACRSLRQNPGSGLDVEGRDPGEGRAATFRSAYSKELSRLLAVPTLSLPQPPSEQVLMPADGEAPEQLLARQRECADAGVLCVAQKTPLLLLAARVGEGALALRGA